MLKHTVIEESSVAGASDLQRLAFRHLWLHYTELASLASAGPAIFDRGEGCYVWDQAGQRHLDALSSLFCVNIGHGRAELADAAACQSKELAYCTNWGIAHPRAIELATRIARLAPGDLNRIFFTSGGSESVETALKLARAYHGLRGERGRYKVISRELAWHGVTFGALSATGLTSARTPFEPLLPGFCHVASTYDYRGASSATDPLAPADEIEHRILFEGPETVAAVILEPVQNSGGCLVPPDGYFQRVKEICDRYGVLLISDDTICSWGRLGTWFGAQRFDYLPDLITTAKGMTSAYAPMGAVIASDRVAQPFLEPGATFAHGLTFGGHPVSAAVAQANLDVIEREQLLAHVSAHESKLHAALEQLLDIPLVGDIRGAGYFWGIELVHDRDSRTPLSPDDASLLVNDVLPSAIAARGLICRVADRGYPVIQLAPPLIASDRQFEEIEAAVRSALLEAVERIRR